MKNKKLNIIGLGLSIAIYSALCMLILSFLGIAGYAKSALKIMESFHIWFSLSFIGIVAGTLEAGVFGFVSGIIIAFLYNKFIK